MTIPRPTFESVPLIEGLQWQDSEGWLFEEKLDGRWCQRWLGNSIVVGELMADGRFFAFDVPVYNGVDVRSWALRERIEVLNTLSLPRPATGRGSDFLRSVIAAGGEGVVSKHLNSPFGVGWIKCKRRETWDLRVTERDFARGSLHLADLMTGEDRGWCNARTRFDRVAVGDVVEIAGHSLTRAGRIREPRFVRPRPDKP